jgi:dihydroxyacetone kinase-like protein
MADTMGTMGALDAAATRRWIEGAARVLSEQRAYLTELDSAIGDADHAVNMERGFLAAVEKVATLPPDAAPGTILRTAGQAVMSGIGGSSGPLWGMAFRRAGQQAGEAPSLDVHAVAAMLEQFVASIRQLGKAEVGDKTMLDALTPAAEMLRARVDAGASLSDALTAACEAADAGARSTIQLQARKGRASYLGARSIGHPEPGETSAVYILRALAATVG